MIATLNGLVSEKVADIVVLDVAGVGYGLLVTTEDFGKLSIGQRVKLYVYEHIRENAHDLFGFTLQDAKQLFEQLLNVNGVGPKMALSLLSIGSTNDVRAAIASGDTKFIQAANGVGKRVAERIVIELKDKVGLMGVDLDESGMLQSNANLLKDEAVEALTALGYSPQVAAQSLAEIDTTLPTQERVKLALRAQR